VWAAAATPKMRVPSSPSSAPSSTLPNLQTPTYGSATHSSMQASASAWNTATP
jgi:hypothetical protein